MTCLNGLLRPIHSGNFPLKALLSPSNISSNITKMTCWMKCSIGLTERKICKKRKKSCWMKKYHVGWKFDREQIFDPTFSGSSNTIFMLDLFTPCFIQHFIVMTYDVISNVRNSNFEWFGKTETLWKIIAMKKNHTYQVEMSLNSSEEDSDHRPKLQEQNGE